MSQDERKEGKIYDPEDLYATGAFVDDDHDDVDAGQEYDDYDDDEIEEINILIERAK